MTRSGDIMVKRKKEVEFVKKNFGKMTYREMGNTLNRSQSYLHGIAKDLGLIQKEYTKDLEGEVWKSPNNYSEYYISNYGRIKSKTRKKSLKTRVHEGYYDCRIIDDSGKKRSPRIHRLVAETFMPNNPSEQNQVNHIDGNKLNNHLDNLEWVTSRQNQMHAIKNGLKKPTTRRILTEENVREICELFQKGMSYSEIENYNPLYKRSRTEGIRQRTRWVKISKDYVW